MAAAEQKKSYEVVKQFKGVNTKANRTAIGDDEFYWLENAMPIGYGNLKITPTYSNVGNVTFTSTVTYYSSASVNLVDYLIAFAYQAADMNLRHFYTAEAVIMP